MTQAVVTGYACIDFPAVLDGFFAGDRTVMIKQRPADAFPRPGGCPLYVARPIAEIGVPVSIVTWVGNDDHGQLFISWTERDGVGVEGIGTIEPGNTPISFMIYQEDGSCGCLFDPGMLGQESLTANQRELIAGADLLCVTVGPPEVSAEALTLIGDDCKVAWVLKKDPLSYPEALRAELASRAQYIFCNRQEREWVDEALAGNRSRHQPTIIETAGSAAVVAGGNINGVRVEVAPLSFDDASGAGDTLAGGCLAAILSGESDLHTIVASGIRAAATLLQARTTEQ